MYEAKRKSPWHLAGVEKIYRKFENDTDHGPVCNVLRSLDYYIMLCYVMLCYVMLCNVMLCYVMFFFVILYYTVLCCVVLCCIILHYITVYYITIITLHYNILLIMIWVAVCVV